MGKKLECDEVNFELNSEFNRQPVKFFENRCDMAVTTRVSDNAS